MKKFFNLKLTSQYTFCPYSLSMDLYKGCPHKCIYCFSQQQYFTNISLKKSSKGLLQAVTGYLDLNKYEKFLKKDMKTTDNKNKLILDLIKLRQPIHVGGMYDPFPFRVENNVKIGKKFLNITNEYQYPIIISTKNPIPEYSDLFKEGKYILQVSVPINEKFSKLIEQNVPTFYDRLDMSKQFKNKAKKMVARIQPFIKGVFKNDDELEQHIKEIKEAGFDAITVEFLKFSTFENLSIKIQKNLLSKITNTNQNKELNEIEGTDKVYPYIYRYKTLLKIRNYARKYGLEFYSAENRFRILGDGFACCGINHKNPKEKDFHTKICYTTNKLLFEAKKKGKITLEDLQEKFKKCPFVNYNKIIDFFNTQGKIYRKSHKLLSLKDLLVNNFISKKSTNPSIFFKGYLIPKKDKKGKIYYEYKEWKP